MCSAILLNDQETRALTVDARVVAVRWDVLPWGLVLDLDAPVAESENAPMRRAWLAFLEVGEITIPMLEARLPTGIWLTSSLQVGPDERGFRVFSCNALLPVFDGNSLRSTGVPSPLAVRARAVLGLASRDSRIGEEYGLGFESRQALCSDRDMLNSLLAR